MTDISRKHAKAGKGDLTSRRILKNSRFPFQQLLLSKPHLHGVLSLSQTAKAGRMETFCSR